MDADPQTPTKRRYRPFKWLKPAHPARALSALSASNNPNSSKPAPAASNTSILISAVSVCIAVIALVINTSITLAHNSWQTRSTQHHDELSVTPHLDVYASNVLETPALLLPGSGNLDISLVLENNGIGPAIVDSISLVDSVSGNKFRSTEEWLNANSIEYSFLQLSTPSRGQYIKEGRRYDLLRVVNVADYNQRPAAERQQIVSSIHNALAKLQLAVEYHSMYGIRQDPLIWTPVERGTITPRIMQRIAKP